MSDYGDDYYSDEGDDFIYVEDEYMLADDLAEHAVQSPPPTVYDEDKVEEWDRFDYFNDIEYASDGYDHATFAPHNQKEDMPKIAQKRKRGTTVGRSKKRPKAIKDHGAPAMDVSRLTNSPIVWRAQTDRGVKPKLLTDHAQSFALLKDWREKMEEAPLWAQKRPTSSSNEILGQPASASESISPVPEPAIDEQEGGGGGEEEDEDAGIDPAALMAALQSRLAAAGGPLSGMDPQQLLQFAMRIANDQDAGDDIAGEMADEMLNQGEEDEDDEAEADLLSWVTQQRDVNKIAPGNGTPSAVVSTPTSEDANRSKRPPTPPSSEANRSVRVTDESMTDAGAKATNNATSEQTSRKRKAETSADTEASSNASKRRATRSLDTSTAASPTTTVPAKTTRSGRVRR